MATTEPVRNISLWHLVADIIMTLLGIYIWFNPMISLLGLALYLGIAFIVVGLGYISASFSFRSSWYLLVGILDLFVGIIFVANLGITAVSLPIIFALWCMAVGAVQIVSSFQLKKNGLPWGWALTAGLLGLVFGLWILAYPAVGTITITALMGAYVFLYGVVEIVEYVSNKRVVVFN